jgi:predicted  nucleic acid-binding Zn-ribbon protein
MHKCAKCGRAATSLEEIDAGCPCGSKVFKFDRQLVADASANEGNGKGIAGSEAGKAALEGGAAGKAAMEGSDGATGRGARDGGNGALEGGSGANVDGAAAGGAGMDGEAGKAARDGGNIAAGSGSGNGAQEGRVPESHFARSTFTGEDVENIKVLTQGVFLLDMRAIAKDPVVLKDEDEIYYVKLPLEQKKPPVALAQPGGGNGKK